MRERNWLRRGRLLVVVDLWVRRERLAEAFVVVFEAGRRRNVLGVDV